jgi:hypothetical protein
MIIFNESSKLVNLIDTGFAYAMIIIIKDKDNLSGKC